MVQLYEEKGVATEDAQIILHTMAKYKTFFVDHMMVQRGRAAAPVHWNSRFSAPGRGVTRWLDLRGFRVTRAVLLCTDIHCCCASFFYLRFCRR